MNKNIRTRQSCLAFPQFRQRSAGFILSGFAVGTVIVAGLFWVMYQLISIVQVIKPQPPVNYGLDFVILKRDLTEPPKREPKVTPPPVFKFPTPVSNAKWVSDGAAPSFIIQQPTKTDLFGDKTGVFAGITQREYMPLTEIQPIYPERALVRGIEGTCVVTYTITKTGSVQDVRVDESRCTSTLFHSSAVKAASKFKYAPRIVDGEHVASENVSKLFRFSITQ